MSVALIPERVARRRSSLVLALVRRRTLATPGAVPAGRVLPAQQVEHHADRELPIGDEVATVKPVPIVAPPVAVEREPRPRVKLPERERLPTIALCHAAVPLV